MDTKKVVGAVVRLVTLVGVLVVFVGLPLTQTQFHYERQYPAGETRNVDLRIDFETTPTTITIRFVDDPALMYSIDVEQYESGLHHSLIYQDEFDSSLRVSIQGIGDQTSAVDITLGTGTYYDIAVDGQHLAISITYNNGAVLSGQDFSTHGINHTLEFVFTEDVNFTTLGLNVRTVLYADVVLSIDLPNGMNGRLAVPSSTPFLYTSMVGWSLTTSIGSPFVYSTSSTTDPLLDFSHENPGTIGGTLRD